MVGGLTYSIELGEAAVITDVAFSEANRAGLHDDVDWRYGRKLDQHGDEPRIQVEVLVDGFGAGRWSIAIVAGDVRADVSWEWQLQLLYATYKVYGQLDAHTPLPHQW